MIMRIDRPETTDTIIEEMEIGAPARDDEGRCFMEFQLPELSEPREVLRKQEIVDNLKLSLARADSSRVAELAPEIGDEELAQVADLAMKWGRGDVDEVHEKHGRLEFVGDQNAAEVWLSMGNGPQEAWIHFCQKVMHVFPRLGKWLCSAFPARSLAPSIAGFERGTLTEE